jgi:MFS family permease
MTPDSPFSYRFVVQISVILVRSCIGLVWASAGPLIPLLMQNFGIDRGQAGWFASVAPLAIAICGIPFGILGARYSFKLTFAIGALLQAGGVFTPLCGGYVPLLFTRICFALGTSITVPIATAIAADWFTARELPMVTGLTQAFVNLGNAIAYLITVPIATVLSWRAPPTIYGAFALTCAVAWMIFGRDAKKSPELRRAFQRSGLNLKQTLFQRSTILLTLAVMGYWCLGNALGAWLPTYYHTEFNMPLTTASSLTSIITIGGIAASLLGGYLPVRLGRRKPFLIIPGIFMGFFGMLAVLFNNYAVIIFFIACFGIMSNLQTPSLFTIPMELEGASSRSGAVVISAMQCGGNLGNFIGPLLVGYLAEVTGSYLPGFIICAVISLNLLVAGIMLKETGRRGKP